VTGVFNRTQVGHPPSEIVASNAEMLFWFMLESCT
jgi:hypothetical protein